MFRNSISRYLLLISISFIFASCAEEESAPDIPGSDRDKYVGSWNCKEIKKNDTLSFTISIEKLGEFDSLRVKNFSLLGFSSSVIWLVSGNSITIPNQVVDGFSFQGTGFFDDGELNLTYNSDNFPATAICTRQ
ncbi:MAG: hypothetical protein ACK5C5_08080 [Bacteroidota bacterium]|jgi:hypothetical protein